jgi:hypothetical protein
MSCVIYIYISSLFSARFITLLVYSACYVAFLKQNYNFNANMANALPLTFILDKESKRKKLNTPVKENFCKNLFQTPKSNQNEGNDFQNDEIFLSNIFKRFQYLRQQINHVIDLNRF